MRPIPAVIEGVRTTLRHRHIVVLCWLATLAFALAIVAPAMAVAFRSVGHSLYLERGFDVQWIAELLFHSRGDLLAVFPPLIGLVLAGQLVLTMFLTGGVIAVLAAPGTSFFAGCARSFPRICRVTVVALGTYALLLGATLGLRSVTSGFEEERTVVIFNGVLAGVALLVFFALNMVFDYAKIFAVTGDGRRPVRAAFRFVGSNPGRTAATYGAVLLLAVALTLAYLGLGKAGLPVVVFVVQQAYLLARSGVRVLFYASQMNVCR